MLNSLITSIGEKIDEAKAFLDDLSLKIQAKVLAIFNAVLGQDQLQHLVGSIPIAFLLMGVFTLFPQIIAVGITLFIIAATREIREGTSKAFYGAAVDETGATLAPFFGVEAELYGLRRALGLGNDPDRKDTFRDVFWVGGAQIGLSVILHFVLLLT